MFDVSFDDNIAELFIQFNGVADTTCLFTCDECAAGTTKWIEDQRVGHAGIHNRIGRKRVGSSIAVTDTFPCTSVATFGIWVSVVLLVAFGFLVEYLETEEEDDPEEWEEEQRPYLSEEDSEDDFSEESEGREDEETEQEGIETEGD